MMNVMRSIRVEQVMAGFDRLSLSPPHQDNNLSGNNLLGEERTQNVEGERENHDDVVDEAGENKDID